MQGKVTKVVSKKTQEIFAAKTFRIITDDEIKN